MPSEKCACGSLCGMGQVYPHSEQRRVFGPPLATTRPSSCGPTPICTRVTWRRCRRHGRRPVRRRRCTAPGRRRNLECAGSELCDARGFRGDGPTPQPRGRAAWPLTCTFESGCRDLNPGPLDPQSSALTKLRHSPLLLFPGHGAEGRTLTPPSAPLVNALSTFGPAVDQGDQASPLTRRGQSRTRRPARR